MGVKRHFWKLTVYDERLGAYIVKKCGLSFNVAKEIETELLYLGIKSRATPQEHFLAHDQWKKVNKEL